MSEIEEKTEPHITTRVISLDEARACGVPYILPRVEPQNVAVAEVLVDGKPVGYLGAYRMTVLGSLWINPEYRKHPGVIRELLGQAGAIARIRGDHWVLGTAENEQMTGYLERLGTEFPKTYAINVGEED